MHRRRRIPWLTLVVALVLGAVVNVGVAWAIATFGSYPETQGEMTTRSTWHQPVPAHWPQRPAAGSSCWTRRSPGQTLINTSTLLTREQSWKQHPSRPEWSIGEVTQRLFRFGVPFRSMEIEFRAEHTGVWTLLVGPGIAPGDLRGADTYENVGANVIAEHGPAVRWSQHLVYIKGLPVGPKLEAPWGHGPTSDAPSIVDERRLLPLRPLVFGSAANTVIYAGLLITLVRAPGALKRWRRRRRGECVYCRYPRGTSTVCTECGRE